MGIGLRMTIRQAHPQDVDQKKFWVHRILPHLEVFKREPASSRMRFIKELSWSSGWAENTLQRQLAALLFLEAQGEDPQEVQAGVSLLAIESVAKIMKQDETEGRRLLREVLARRLSTRQVADVYNAHYGQRHQRGGYNRSSDALASIHSDAGHNERVLAANQPVTHDVQQRDRSQVGRIPAAGSDTTPEIAVPMSLVVRRLVAAFGNRFSGPVRVHFDPGAVHGDAGISRLQPTLSVEQTGQARALVFAADGASESGSLAEQALVAALWRSLAGGDHVHAYVTGPSAELAAEIADMLTHEDGRIDVRRERIMIRNLRRLEEVDVASISEIIDLIA